MSTIANPRALPQDLPYLLARFTRRGPKFWRDALTGYCMALPWLIGFFTFTIAPMLLSLYYSLNFYRITLPPRWIGFKNYSVLIVGDPRFRLSLYNTAYYVAGKVPLTILVSLAVAVLLNQPIRGRSVFRSIYYLPSVVSGVANAMLWLWIFNPRLGLINVLLALLGIRGPNWLFSYEWAKPAFILMSVWSMGGTMVVFLAGLQSVPVQLLEAAEIDGARPWQRFWNVTLPLLSPTIFFNVITQVIGSLQVFVQVYIWTTHAGLGPGEGAGPRNSLLFYVLYLFNRAFGEMRMGYASAMAWILFAIIMTLTLIQFRLARHWVYYESHPQGGA